MFGIGKTDFEKVKKLSVEIALLRAAIFRSSPEVAQAYREIINEVLQSDVEMESDMIELLADLVGESNEAVGVPKFF